MHIIVYATSTLRIPVLLQFTIACISVCINYILPLQHKMRNYFNRLASFAGFSFQDIKSAALATCAFLQ